MSRLRVFEETDPSTPTLVTGEPAAIARELSAIGVRFEQWGAGRAGGSEVMPGAPAEEVLAAHRSSIDTIVAEKGFRTVDVVSVSPDHPAREAMRKKFLDEHVHDEDEVRFFVAGSGLFTLHVGERVLEIRCEAGDLIGVPGGTRHWFDMGPSPSFVAIRFFLEPEGWVGHFTGADIAERFPRFEPAP